MPNLVAKKGTPASNRPTATPILEPTTRPQHPKSKRKVVPVTKILVETVVVVVAAIVIAIDLVVVLVPLFVAAMIVGAKSANVFTSPIFRLM